MLINRVRSGAAAVALLLALANPSVGQTGAEQDHTAYHPDETQSGAIQPGADQPTPGSPPRKLARQLQMRLRWARLRCT